MKRNWRVSVYYGSNNYHVRMATFEALYARNAAMMFVDMYFKGELVFDGRKEQTEQNFGDVYSFGWTGSGQRIWARTFQD